MTEALNEVVDYGFKNMGLEAYTNKSNLKSIALLEQSQFTYVSDFIRMR